MMAFCQSWWFRFCQGSHWMKPTAWCMVTDWALSRIDNETSQLDIELTLNPLQPYYLYFKPSLMRPVRVNALKDKYQEVWNWSVNIQSPDLEAEIGYEKQIQVMHILNNAIKYYLMVGKRKVGWNIRCPVDYSISDEGCWDSQERLATHGSFNE